MQVAICSAVWGRLPLTRIWWHGLARVCRRFARHGIAASVTVVGSQLPHRDLAIRHGATWVRTANAPLGRKWNAAVESACAQADYILILRSDDFLSDALVDRYVKLIRAGWLYVGLSGIYFYEPATMRLARFQSRPGRYGSPLGAGRLVHTRLLEVEGFRPWLDGRERALDANMTARCKLPVAKLIQVGREMPAVDVKTEGNLWGFDQLRAYYPSLRCIPGPLRGIPEWSRIVRLTG
jgi:hypothetical protein